MFQKTTRRGAPEVNAGSMADIAFLLLIFFLVTTKILSENGIMVMLPHWDDAPVARPANERNVLRIAINQWDQLMIEGVSRQLTDVRPFAQQFILNPEGRSDMAAAPNKVVVSLAHHRGTSYATYLHVYSELRAAWHDIWQEAALVQYQIDYDLLPPEKQAQIRNRYPMVISEAEPAG
ncbi:MAG: biopolymer transporter ExbD [Saprospiraceae bacterium]